jgi:hypothetical protein
MIDLNVLSEKRQYAYHLTSRINLPSIVACSALLSASILLERAHGTGAREEIRRRRPGPAPERIVVDGRPVEIRDQHTISEKALSKCLEGGIQIPDYYELLNYRVFLWPTTERLGRHYARYASERPVLLRFSTNDLLDLNPHVEFSRLNSGATRPNSHLGGIAPKRGRNTFQSAEICNLRISEIAEVTFPERCRLPDVFWTSKTPEGPWRKRHANGSESS